MKRKRFTEDQIITILREHEVGAKAGDLACKHGISEATLYKGPSVERTCSRFKGLRLGPSFGRPTCP